MQQGELEGAETLAREVLRDARERFGIGHWQTTGAMASLGTILEMQGELDEAQALLEQSIRLSEANGVIPFMQYSNLAWVHYKRGKLVEAEAGFRKAVEHERQRLRGRTGQLGSNLAMVLTDLGQLDEAERVGREALQTVIERYGESSWWTGNTRGPYARALAALGRFAEAEKEMLEAHRVLLDQLGPDHERTQRVIGYMIDLYEAWHRGEPGKGYAEKAAQWRTRLEEFTTKAPQHEAMEAKEHGGEPSTQPETEEDAHPLQDEGADR